MGTITPCAPASITRLIWTGSLAESLTNGHIPDNATIRISSSASRIVITLCSRSTASQSNPALDMISAIAGWASVIHEPRVSCRRCSLDFNDVTQNLHHQHALVIPKGKHLLILCTIHNKLHIILQHVSLKGSTINNFRDELVYVLIVIWHVLPVFLQ